MHAGGDDDFEFFASLLEALREAGDDGIAAPGGDGCHIEDTADRRASATDGASALEFATVTVVGSQAGERADLLAVEGSQFGEFGQEGECSRVSDPRGAAEQLDLGLPVIVGFHEFGELFFDPLDLAIEDVNDMLDALTDTGDSDGFATVGFGSAELDELPPATDQLLQNRFIFSRFGGNSRFHLLPKSGNDVSIDAVRLGEDVEGFGEIANLSGVHHGHEVSGLEEFSNDAPVIGPRGLDDDQTGTRFRQRPVELLQTGGIIVNGETLLFRENTEIELVLGDIDTDERGERTFHGNVPVLQMRTRRGR